MDPKINLFLEVYIFNILCSPECIVKSYYTSFYSASPYTMFLSINSYSSVSRYCHFFDVPSLLSLSRFLCEKYVDSIFRRVTL